MDPDKVLSFTTLTNRAKSSKAGPELWGLLKNTLLDSGKRYAMHNMECGQLNQLIGYYHKTEARLKELAPSPGSTDSGQSGGLDIYTKSFEKGQKLFGSDEDVHYRKSHRGGLCLPHESDSSEGTMAASPHLTNRSETPATEISAVHRPQDSRRRRAPSEVPSVADTLPSVKEMLEGVPPDHGQNNKLPPSIDSTSMAALPAYNRHSGLALQARQSYPDPYNMNELGGTRHVMQESLVHKDHERERVQMMTDGQCDARMLDMRGFVAGNDDLLPQSYGQEQFHNWLDHIPSGQPWEEERNYIPCGFPALSSFTM